MVSRTCRGMIAMQKVYGFSRVVVWNLTCSLMNSVRKVRAGIDGKRRRRMLYFLGNWNFEDIRVIESRVSLCSMMLFLPLLHLLPKRVFLDGEFLRFPPKLSTDPRPQLNIHQKLLRHPVSWQALPRSPSISHLRNATSAASAFLKVSPGFFQRK